MERQRETEREREREREGQTEREKVFYCTIATYRNNLLTDARPCGQDGQRSSGCSNQSLVLLPREQDHDLHTIIAALKQILNLRTETREQSSEYGHNV